MFSAKVRLFFLTTKKNLKIFKKNWDTEEFNMQKGSKNPFF